MPHFWNLVCLKSLLISVNGQKLAESGYVHAGWACKFLENMSQIGISN